MSILERKIALYPSGNSGVRILAELDGHKVEGGVLIALINSVLICCYMPSKKVNPAETDSTATIPAIDPGLRYEEALKPREISQSDGVWQTFFGGDLVGLSARHSSFKALPGGSGPS
jgi:Zn/Cd-binding protein ZinT